MDVSSRGMPLVVEGKALSFGDTARLHWNRRAASPSYDHVSVIYINVEASSEARQTKLEQLARNFNITVASHKCT
jgi:hypothetical protein